jgi:hypothetical protein
VNPAEKESVDAMRKKAMRKCTLLRMVEEDIKSKIFEHEGHQGHEGKEKSPSAMRNRSGELHEVRRAIETP